MPPPKPVNALQKALHKLGLARDIDLALHLPMRYEDETTITRLRDAREGDTVQHRLRRAGRVPGQVVQAQRVHALDAKPAPAAPTAVRETDIVR